MKMKRFLTMFLAVTLLFGALPNVGSLVSAADGGSVSGNDTILQGKEIDTEYGSAVKGSDGKTYTEYDMLAIKYKSDGTYTTRQTGEDTAHELIGIDSNGNQSWLYCVEKDRTFKDDLTFESSSADQSSYLKYGGYLSKALNKLARDKNISGLDGDMSIQYILMSTIYGWQPGEDMPQTLKDHGLNDWDWYFGTQVVIWEFQQGIRQSPTQRSGNGYNSGTVLYKSVQNRPAEYAYNYVLDMMAQHYTVPSFTSDDRDTIPTHTLKWNSANQRYELTLTDTKNYQFNLKFSDSNIKSTKNGNKYTIYTTKTIPTAVTQATQKDMNISNNKKLLVWGSSGKQTMMSGMQDPVEFFMKVQTDLPTVTIKKTGTSSEDIANKLFYVYKDNSSTACLKLTTDSNGNASGKLPGDGSYKVVEQNASKYNVTYTINGANTQTFTYPGSRDANNNVTVNVKNTERDGTLQLKKEADDNKVQGLQFRIEGNGTSITGTTNADGYVVVNGSTNIPLKPGTYTVTEINTPDRYDQPAPITVVIEANKNTFRVVKNTNTESKLKIIKTSESGKVDGFTFSVVGTTVKGEEVNLTAVTGADGTIVVDMDQGTYTVTEINLSKEYEQPAPQTVTLSDGEGEEVSFRNYYAPGKLNLIKTSEDL